MLLYILIAVALLLALFVVVVLTRPSAFRIARSATIAAPADAVFQLVNDFHQWRAWSPWEKLDPALQRTYAGKPSGVGAVYSWKGNNKVGEGRMTIEQTDPARLIIIKLEFLKPFAATNTARFTFEPAADGTKITWEMSGGSRNFICKAFSLFMNMDKMIGGEFEKGLAAMKGIAEKGELAPT